MRAELLASTVTPGTTLPVASATCPAIVPCAHTVEGNRTRQALRTSPRMSGVDKGISFMDLPPPHEKPRLTESKREQWTDCPQTARAQGFVNKLCLHGCTGTVSADRPPGWRIFGLKRD